MQCASPGVGKNMTVMLPVLQWIVELLQTGPNITAKTENNGTVVVPPLVVAFTHDNEINELASLLGVFDEQTELSARRRDPNRVCPFLDLLCMFVFIFL